MQQLVSYTPGKCADVQGASGADLAPIVHWTCHGALNQRFDVTDLGSGWHQLKFKHSNKCLDVPNNSLTQGTQLIQYVCNGGDNQKFTLPASTAVGTVTVKHSGMCVTMLSVPTPGILAQMQCSGSSYQKWLLGDKANDTFTHAQSGFAGKWGLVGETHPSTHHLTECAPAQSGWYEYDPGCGFGEGDWSIDYYQLDGTLVTYKGIENGGLVTPVVWAVMPTCGNTNAYGYTVFVNLTIHGDLQGWMAYAHVENPQVSAGQQLTYGQAIGYVNWWPNLEGCWQVNGPAGVHIHVEMWNLVSFACYVDHTWGALLASGTTLGHVGRTQYTGIRQTCY